MTNLRLKFTVEQKLQIIQEAYQHRITKAFRKHNLSHLVFNRWRNSFNQGGVSLLKSHLHKVDPEVKALQERIHL
jgi:transposase-like protein